MRARTFGWVVGAVLAMACAPRSTGGALVTFQAYASGPTLGRPLEVDTATGYHVVLQEARMRVGAIYLRLGRTNPGSSNASCVGDTTYGLQVPGGADIDLLGERPQELATTGEATTDRDLSAEIWLVDGDLNRVASHTAVVAVAGTASRAGHSTPFRATVTIGDNRLVPPSDPAKPGANPICKQRIIAPIPVSITPSAGGRLLLAIDPRPWFDDIDFSNLLPDGDGTLVIPDVRTGAGPDADAARAFFGAVTGASPDVYRFRWLAADGSAPDLRSEEKE